MLVLCFAFFVATASGASLCKCTEEEKKVKVISNSSSLILSFFQFTKAMKRNLIESSYRANGMYSFWETWRRFSNNERAFEELSAKPDKTQILLMSI